MSAASPARRAEPATAMPVLRWMGNKAALLGPLRATFARLAEEGSTLVDPFAGSHVVTVDAKQRHRVVAADAQVASAVVGRAFLENRTVRRVSDETLRSLHDEVQGAARGHEEPSRAPGWFERTYAETYLGREQCRELDELRAAIDRVAPDDDEPVRALALSALMLACCRAQASPGHFAQFLPPDHPRTLALRRASVIATALDALRSFRVEPGRAGARSLHAGWAELVERDDLGLGDAAIWYLDPPYTRDQYSRFYHFLETVVLDDRPEVTHGGLYRPGRFRSAFCTSGAGDELRRLLASVREASPRATVVLSYSSQGILTREELIEVARATHELRDASDHAHAYSTQGKGRLDGVSEWILTFAPR